MLAQENHVIDWLPAYVLGALTEQETNQVKEHLVECQSCQVECAHLQALADDLPLALVQTSPSPQVKTQLMQAIHSPQAKTASIDRSTIWQRLGTLLGQRIPALGLALILLMVVSNVLLWRQLNITNQRANTPLRIIALTNTKAAPQAVGTLVTDQKLDYGTLVVDNLDRLDSSRQYQVWLFQDGKRVSGGVFSVNSDGYGSLEIHTPLPLNQYNSIGITIEPYGGSPGPTGAKVLGVDIIQ